MRDDEAILAQIRERLAARGEPADDYTDDDELREALRVVLVDLAQRYAAEQGPPDP